MASMPLIWEKQSEYVNTLARKARAFVLLAPRSGKTVVSIKAALQSGAQFVLVIAPAILRDQWYSEIAKWAPVEDRAKFDVISYNTLIAQASALNGYDTVIVDESVSIKNRKSRRFNSLKELIRNNKPARLWLLTGNPAPRYLDDLWAQLHILNPREYSSYWRFVQKHCVIEQTPWGTKIKGNANDGKWLYDLPDVIVGGWERKTDEAVIWTPLGKNEERLYRAIQKSELKILRDNGIGVSINPLNVLSQSLHFVNNPQAFGADLHNHKTKALEELLSFVPRPVLVFHHYRSTGELLERAGLRVLNGNTKDRGELVNWFKECGDGENAILALTIDIGAYGLTLPAKTVIFMERTFNADLYSQAIYRAVLPSQEYLTQVWLMVTPRTVDEAVHRVVSEREKLTYKLLNEVLGGDETDEE